MNYISTYLQHQRQMLEESVSQFLTEGKHWPQDYLRTASDKLKSRFPGTSDEDIRRIVTKVQKDIESIPAAHEGTWIQWHPKWWSILDFIALKAGDGLQTFDEVEKLIDRTLPKIIKGLPVLAASSDPDCSPAAIKTKSFEDFLQTIDKAVAASNDIPDSSEDSSSSEYEVVPISSYYQMNSLFGGPRTGYGSEKSAWCHTNGEGTYNSRSWTNYGMSKKFFVLAKKGWEDIKPCRPSESDSAFDEYGSSLIAILVDVKTGDLAAETLRWNHEKIPPNSLVDHAFGDDWSKLNAFVGLDVKSICSKNLEHEREILNDKAAHSSIMLSKALEKCVHSNGVLSQFDIPYDIHDAITADIVIPDGIISIDTFMFNGMNMKSVSLPSTLTAIGEYAFASCKNLTSIAIPSSVQIFGQSMFSECKQLAHAEIHAQLSALPDDTFFGCKQLTSVAIPQSTTYIGSHAFYICESLKSVDIPQSVDYIGKNAFGFSGIKQLEIPHGVEVIEKSMAYGCHSLTSVSIPDTVKVIEDHAFDSCDHVKQIVIPASVASIGKNSLDWDVESVLFMGKTIEEVKDMDNYPFGAFSANMSAELKTHI